MEKKGAIILSVVVILVILSIFPVYAQSSNSSSDNDEEDEKIDKAYQCMKDKVATDCSALTSDEQLFSLLALGDYEDCRNEFMDNSRNQECWPSNNCRLKDTALALIALDRAGASTAETTKIENWLLNQTKPASDLTWFIEIDADTETSCNIKYDSSSYTTQINEDKTIESGAGSCLSVSLNGYWLQISSNCLEKEYKISCDKDFKTTLLYKTQQSSTIHVSSKLNSESANAEAIEKVTFKCFSQGTVCNYEGSLWGAMALNKQGYETQEFIPYLDAFASENKGFFPESFLYILTSNNDFFTKVLQDNFNGNYWQVGTYNKEYNSALAFLAVGDKTATQVADAKEYFLNNQDDNGCWNNVKDTGFLLYSAWPRSVSSNRQCNSDSDCGLGRACTGGFCSSSSNKDCESYGNFCELYSDCVDAGGLALNDYTCTGSKVCCTEDYTLPTCAQQSGELCERNEVCSGNILDSSDIKVCCSEQCEADVIIDEENLCEQSNGVCRSDCLDDEQEDLGLSCSSSAQACCMPKETSYLWVWILLVAILIIILLIIFRDKLKLLIFRVKNKFKGGKPTTTRPPLYPPSSAMPLRQFRPSPPVTRRPSYTPTQSKKSPVDSEFEETLKKLKELSK